MRRVVLYLLLFTSLPSLLLSQEFDAPFFEASPQYSRKRMYAVAGSEIALAGGSLVALNQLWYAQYRSQEFHTFNDAAEWKQMDKAGHVQTAYTTGIMCHSLLHWAGAKNRKRAVLAGALTGYTYMLCIELMDGYSEGWGFSWSDIGANSMGSLLFMGQQLAWDEQRIQIKFGFQPSGYAQWRPGLLGSNTGQQILKDYNGQTYWVSVNPSSFIGEETRIPSWINVAFGYGANGMISAREGQPVLHPDGYLISFKQYRQYYLSLDVDLYKLPVRTPWLRAVVRTFGFIKVPFPGLELSNGKVKGVWLAF